MGRRGEAVRRQGGVTPPPFWRRLAEGVELRVRAQPKAKRPGIAGVTEGADGPRLRVAVSAAPEDGRANRAVAGAIADLLDVAPSAVSLVAGATAREKTFRVAGDPGVLEAALARISAARG